MNNPSPLLPQGSLVEQKNKNRTRVKIAVFFVLAIHGIGLLALLMQGCKHDDKTAQTDQTNSLDSIPFAPTNAVVAAETNIPTNSPQTIVDSVPPVGGSATEYVIARGDNFSTIAKKFHISTKAIADANPGVEPTKLQIGQKIHVPAPAATANPGGTGAPMVDTSSGEQLYTVKSGDTLTTIARNFGTTIKAIRSANDLKTDSIKVGQKLKIPVKAATPDATPAGGGPGAPPPAH